MAISRIGTATGTTTCTVPTHAIGDLIIIAAFNASSTTVPTLGSGYKSITTKAGTTCAMRVGYKIATATNDASGTWTNSTELVCHVYRPTGGNQIGVGGFATSSGTTNTLTFPSITFGKSDYTSWVAAFIGSSSTTQTISTAPSGMVNESSVTGTAQAAGHDTAQGQNSWSSTNVTATGTAGNWVSAVVEIEDCFFDEWSLQNIQLGTVTYSNNNKTVVGGATVQVAACHITTHASGKYYLECQSINGIADASLAISIGDNTHSNFMGLSDNGDYHDTSGGGIATLTTYNSGDWVALAVDITNSIAWWKNLTQSGQWNQSGTANPGTNTGGLAYASGLFTTAFLWMYTSTTGEGLQVNGGSSPFLGPLPAGFTPWNGFTNGFIRLPPRPLLRR